MDRAAVLGFIKDKRRRARVEAFLRENLPLAKPGEVGRGRDRVDHVNSRQGGNSGDYLTARIHRDAPDVFERLQAGEFPSAKVTACHL